MAGRWCCEMEFVGSQCPVYVACDSTADFIIYVTAADWTKNTIFRGFFPIHSLPVHGEVPTGETYYWLREECRKWADKSNILEA